MSTSLAQLRAQIADDLEAGGVVPAFGYVPERVTPPAAIVLPDEPYLSEDDTTACGNFRVRHRVVIVGARGTNAGEADRMDELIVQAVAGLEAGDSVVLRVAEPMEVELSGATYLGTVASIENLVRLEIV